MSVTKPTLTPALRNEYQLLFDTCQIRPEKRAIVQKAVDEITSARARYANVADELNVPWYVVGVIHNMEGSLNFATHLHNGDPLSARTVQVPRRQTSQGQSAIHMGNQCCGCVNSAGL
jgi:lysozyme family protein